MNATTAPRTRHQAAIDRATARAHEQAQAGNLPRLIRQYDAPGETRQVWSVGSRVTAGTVYTVDAVASADGISTLCDCDGAVGGRICWHRASVRAAILGDIASHDSRPRTPVVKRLLTREDIFGLQAAC